ncbi:hypothetical protein [Maribacter sp. 2210JD10-5]|uniref:hypothetical protein n=1 Tax=Maribacter sp. 2210JD10-5 TaxID=3386272 RepID=UPI0039BD7315
MNLYRYKEWFDAGEMHEHSKEWFSELSFIRDEQKFLDKLITSFATKSLDRKKFKKLDDFRIAIQKNQQIVMSLLKKIQSHMNRLELLTDKVDQLDMEKAYRKKHKELFNNVENHVLDFKRIKQEGFLTLTDLLKDSKRMAIGNPEYKLTAKL